MKDDSDSQKIEHDGYFWSAQNCQICEAVPTKFIGKRGGDSHRENLGVETEIWECTRCEFLFPNPVPIPVGGLGQHYDVGADAYFQHHDLGQKLEKAKKLVTQAADLLGFKGRLLDVGIGRGEILIAAKENGWSVEGVEPSVSLRTMRKIG